MATQRTKRKEHGEHTDASVKAFAAKWGYADQEAWRYLAQYALNRLATLAAYEAKKPAKPTKAPKTPKAKSKPAAKPATKAAA